MFTAFGSIDIEWLEKDWSESKSQYFVCGFNAKTSDSTGDKNKKINLLDLKFKMCNYPIEID